MALKGDEGLWAGGGSPCVGSEGRGGGGVVEIHTALRPAGHSMQCTI